MKYGKFSASIIPSFTSTMGFFSVVLVYYIAVNMGHQKPLPHTWISKCAQHYPQYLIFRVGTISGAVLMIVSYFINHFVLMQKAYDKAFNIHKYYPQISLVCGLIGAIFLTGNTALIDTGKMNVHLHVLCAGQFFLWTIVANLYNYIISIILYKKAKIGSLKVVIIKLILTVLLIFQFALSQMKNDSNEGLASILEFTLAFTVLSNFWVVAMDAKKYDLVYDMVK